MYTPQIKQINHKYHFGIFMSFGDPTPPPQKKKKKVPTQITSTKNQATFM